MFINFHTYKVYKTQFSLQFIIKHRLFPILSPHNFHQISRCGIVAQRPPSLGPPWGCQAWRAPSWSLPSVLWASLCPMMRFRTEVSMARCFLWQEDVGSMVMAWWLQHHHNDLELCEQLSDVSWWFLSCFLIVAVNHFGSLYTFFFLNPFFFSWAAPPQSTYHWANSRISWISGTWTSQERSSNWAEVGWLGVGIAVCNSSFYN